jgi:hypothetical protein
MPGTNKRTSKKPNVPIRVRQHRKRPPGERGRKYTKFAEQTVKISDYLQMVLNQVEATQQERGAVSYVVKHHPITQPTLSRHWNRWKDRLLSEGLTDTLREEINRERRGGHNMSLLQHEELELDTILASINHGAHQDFTNDVIKRKAKIIFKKRQLASGGVYKPFKASDGWCTGLKKRWCMSSGTRSIKNPHQPPNETEIEEFIGEGQRQVASVGTDQFYNLDETKWHLVHPQRIIVKRRGEHPIIRAPAKKSRGFTVILGGNASGMKIRPSIIIKSDNDADMEPYKAKYGDTVNIYRSHSGWCNSDIICDVIRREIVPRQAGQRAALILDKYGGHNSNEVKTTCSGSNINLLMVPGGATPICQPMDRVSIGATKSHAHTLYGNWCEEHVGQEITYMDAVDLLLQSWREIHITAITFGFLGALRYTEWPSDVTNDSAIVRHRKEREAANHESKEPIESSDGHRSLRSSSSSSHVVLPLPTRKRPRARGQAVFDFPGMVGTTIIDPNYIDERPSKRAKFNT